MPKQNPALNTRSHSPSNKTPNTPSAPVSSITPYKNAIAPIAAPINQLPPALTLGTAAPLLPVGAGPLDVGDEAPTEVPPPEPDEADPLWEPEPEAGAEGAELDFIGVLDGPGAVTDI